MICNCSMTSHQSDYLQKSVCPEGTRAARNPELLRIKGASLNIVLHSRPLTRTLIQESRNSSTLWRKLVLVWWPLNTVHGIQISALHNLLLYGKISMLKTCASASVVDHMTCTVCTLIGCHPDMKTNFPKRAIAHNSHNECVSIQVCMSNDFLL